MEKLDNDILFVGATRPAMIFGVSFGYQVVNGFSVAIIFLAMGNPMYFLLVVPFHLFGYILCANEPRQIELVGSWVICVSKCNNRFMWGGSTYLP